VTEAYDPRTLVWHEGEVPAVEDVPYDCRIILSTVIRIEIDCKGTVVEHKSFGTIVPWGNELNWLRWESSGVWLDVRRPTGFWAWLERGFASRPANVKTFAEAFPEDEPDKGATAP